MQNIGKNSFNADIKIIKRIVQLINVCANLKIRFNLTIGMRKLKLKSVQITWKCIT